jgi:hypothetical protein
VLSAERVQIATWAATFLVLGCGRETLELFPNNHQGAATSLDGGDLATDAAVDAAVRDAAATDSPLLPNDSGLPDGEGSLADASPAAFEAGAGGGCQTDSDCHGENHRCQPGLHVCVQCIGDPNDCAKQGNESKCNLVNYTCAAPCAADGKCPSPDVCDSQGVCTDCLNSSQCPADQPRCVNEECVCLSDADCNGGVCDSDQTCK